MSSRIETLLRGIIDNTGQSSAQPESRIEAMLNEIIAGGGGRFAIHICEEGEYNASTGVPTISQPEENTFYLVPLDFGVDSYEEYIYLNGAWERFGGTTQATSQQDDWEWVQSVVRAGSANRHFDIGDQLITTYTTANTTYQMPWDVVDISPVVNASGQTVPGLWLQSHYAIGNTNCPITAFDASEAIYVVTGEENLSPGDTVYFTLGNNIGSSGKANAGDVISFTIPSEAVIKSGTKFAIATESSPYYWNADVNARTTWRAYGYDPDDDANNFGPISIGNSTSGTNLGMASTGSQRGTSGIGELLSADSGSSRWKESAMRQWLNYASSSGSWWSPQSSYDLPPLQVTTINGFQTGLSSDFLNVVSQVQVSTITDTANAVVDTTLDKFFIPSLEQVHYTTVTNGSGLEGHAWPYWVEVFGTTNPVSSSSKGIHYILTNRTTTCVSLTRTKHDSTSLNGISSAGSISRYKSAVSYQITPCCVIC